MKTIPNFLFSPFFIAALFVVSLLIRIAGLGWVNDDIRFAFIPWYDHILRQGVMSLVRDPAVTYPPPYLYLLALATLTNSFIPKLIAIKLIPTLFDFYNAFIFSKIVGLKYPQTRIPWLAGALVFLLPTVMLNSSYWGQVDVLFTSLLLTCLYFVLLKRPGWGMLFFAVAACIKLQSCFLLPWLVALSLKKRIPWKYYVYVPLAYLLFGVPALAAGSSLPDIVSVYVRQVHMFSAWSLLAPNPYLFFDLGVPASASNFMVICAGILMAAWVVFTVKHDLLDEPGGMLISALGILSLAPYILPHMHERYFYPQDIFTLLVAFYFPKLWPFPILSQAVSMLTYSMFLLPAFFTTFPALRGAALVLAFTINSLLLFLILREQIQMAGYQNRMRLAQSS